MLRDFAGSNTGPCRRQWRGQCYRRQYRERGRLTRTGTVLRNTRYLAAEQVNGRSTDARAAAWMIRTLLFASVSGTLVVVGRLLLLDSLRELSASLTECACELRQLGASEQEQDHSEDE
jgi:hypothetical protein